MASPISSPQPKDLNPPPIAAVARATDELTWALVKLLVAKNLISSELLAAALRESLDKLRRSGRIESKTDEEHFAASLALDRVVKALEQMA